MDHCLTDLDERPGGTSLLAEAFHVVHTIKRATGFPGFKRLEKLGYEGEKLLGLLRDGKREEMAPVIAGLLQLLDLLRLILKTIDLQGHEGRGEDAALIALMAALQTPEPVLAGEIWQYKLKSTGVGMYFRVFAAIPVQVWRSPACFPRGSYQITYCILKISL